MYTVECVFEKTIKIGGCNKLIGPNKQSSFDVTICTPNVKKVKK